jgi:hypothetical protein
MPILFNNSNYLIVLQSNKEAKKNEIEQAAIMKKDESIPRTAGQDHNQRA